MNFSKVVTLPKAYTDKYLTAEYKAVEVAVNTKDGSLVLTPVRERSPLESLED